MQRIPESKPIIVLKKKWEVFCKEGGGSGAETIWQILQPSSTVTCLKHCGGKIHHPFQCETRLHVEAEPLLARTYLTTLARLVTVSNRPTCLITGGIRWYQQLLNLRGWRSRQAKIQTVCKHRQHAAQTGGIKHLGTSLWQAGNTSTSVKCIKDIRIERENWPVWSRYNCQENKKNCLLLNAKVLYI